MTRLGTRNGELPRSQQPTARSDQSSADEGVRSPLALARSPAVDSRGDEGDVADGEMDLEGAYLRHGSRVSCWASRLAGPGVDIEDIVHDVFLVVQRRIGEFRGDARMSTWLYEITVRVVQARRRKWRRARWLSVFGGETRRSGADGIDIVDQRISALEALERRQATVLVYRLLDELDEKYRTAVVLFELEGLPCQEIAAITGTSISNVWARVSRGREKLIQAFAEWEKEKAK